MVERVMELTDGRGADVVITATAANVEQEQVIRKAARRGRISFFAMDAFGIVARGEAIEVTIEP